MTSGSNHSDDGAALRSHPDRWNRKGNSVSLVRCRQDEKIIGFDAQPQAVEVDLNACAFVIIDMQNDFLHSEGWFAAERGADVAPLAGPVPAINALADAFRGNRVPVIHVNWGVRPDAANLPANVLDKGSDCGARAGYAEEIPSGCVLVSGGWGSRSIEDIDIAPDDLVVHKHRLSGFRDNELDQILRRLGVRHLFFAGVNVDRCVFATLMDAAFEGYDTILIEDACATVSPQFVEDAILYLVRLLYGFSARSTDILPGLVDAASN